MEAAKIERGKFLEALCCFVVFLLQFSGSSLLLIRFFIVFGISVTPRIFKLSM